MTALHSGKRQHGRGLFTFSTYGTGVRVNETLSPPHVIDSKGIVSRSGMWRYRSGVVTKESQGGVGGQGRCPYGLGTLKTKSRGVR